MSSEMKPKEYLMSMEVGPDAAIQVAPDVADTYRTTASRMKMYGMKFKTKTIEPGSPRDALGCGGMIITRVK